jgi:hypothetical protein
LNGISPTPKISKLYKVYRLLVSITNPKNGRNSQRFLKISQFELIDMTLLHELAQEGNNKPPRPPESHPNWEKLQESFPVTYHVAPPSRDLDAVYLQEAFRRVDLDALRRIFGSVFLPDKARQHLTLACQDGNAEVVKTLLEVKVPPSASPDTCCENPGELLFCSTTDLPGNQSGGFFRAFRDRRNFA